MDRLLRKKSVQRERTDCQVLPRVSQALSQAVARMAVIEGQVMACGRNDGQDVAE